MLLHSVGSVTWVDEDLQINALHFVPKLVMILQCNINATMASTALSGIVFAF